MTREKDAVQQRQLLSVSRIIGVPVQGSAGELIGPLMDVVARVRDPGDERFPPLTGLVIRTGGRKGHGVFVPWEDVRRLSATEVVLSSSRLDFRPFARRDGELLVMHDVVDKQVVDVGGRRVVRVNDVLLAPDPSKRRGWRVAAADVGIGAFLGRVAPRALSERVAARFAGVASVIPWDQVEFFASDVPGVKLRVSHRSLARLHPADIAELIGELGYRQSEEVVASLDDSTAADVVENLPEELQSALLTTLSDDKAADILEEMEPDVAADILASLPRSEAHDLLEAMEPEEAADVSRLLEHPADTAGGLMTTNYVALSASLTAGEAIEELRRAEWLPDLLNTIYLIDSPETERLVGVVSLRDLLLAKPHERLRTLSAPQVVSVPVGEEAESAAEMLAHYGLLALPVVDGDSRLLGVITMDDALDLLLPEEWKPRLPRVFR
ncbi:MAG TPA: CBS domain-containing protein [Chloroflexota bacterium]|nr:CBS domain-containing protein [Chloroflexota bacterium]